MTAVKLREWRGVKPVAGPAGVAITTRLHTTPADEYVLDLVARHLGGLRRADLARVCHPVPLDPSLDGEAKRQSRRDRLNTRKKALTAQSSARWANAIIAANDAQYQSARDAQHRYIVSLRAAIDTIEKRLAQPTADTLKMGATIPDDVEIRVWDSSAEARYLVLPMRPDGTADMSEEQLAGVVTRDSMIGVQRL